jgi:hypothetical protein
MAENAKIEDVWNSDKPNSLARGGTITKTNDCPNPTVKRPNLSQEEPDLFIKIFS